MNKQTFLLGLALILGAQPITALPFDFLNGLTNHSSALSYEKPQTVMSPIREDIARRKGLIKQASLEVDAAKQGVNRILFQLDSLTQKNIDAALRWLETTGHLCKSLPLKPEIRQQLECVIILSMGVYLYEKMQESLFSILKNLDRHIRYWEKQQASPLSHTIHRPLSEWFSSNPAQQHVVNNLMHLRKMHEENCATLGDFAAKAERFESEEEAIEKKYEWLASVLHTLYKNNQTKPDITPTFESLENALINIGRQIKKYPEAIETQIAIAKPPSHFGRNWVRYLGVGIGTVAGLSYYLANKEWVHDRASSAFDTFIGSPAKNFWNTIFNYDRKRQMPDATPHRDKLVEGINKLLDVNHNLIDTLGQGVEATNQSVKDALGELSPKQNYDELIHKYNAQIDITSPHVQAAVDKIKAQNPLSEQEEFALKQQIRPLLTKDLQETYKDKSEIMQKRHTDLTDQQIQANAQNLDTRFLFDRISTSIDNVSAASLAKDNDTSYTGRLTKALPPANTKDEVVNIANAINLLKNIGIRNVDAAIDILKTNGNNGLNIMSGAFKNAGPDISDAKTTINEGMQGMLECGEKHATLATNMLDATRNVIAIGAILPTVFATVFGGYKLWKWMKGMIYREPDYISMRRALIDTAHILNSYDYEHLSQMMPEHYGRLLYNVHELKTQAALLPEPARHQCLLDIERIASTHLTSEKKMNVINLMYSSYGFLSAKAA